MTDILIIEILMLMGLPYMYLTYGIISTGLFDVKTKHRQRRDTVSAIIASKDDFAVLDQTLARLKKSNYPPYEIIIVESGDIKKTGSIARKFGAKVIKDNDNKGKENALIIGSKKAKGKYIYVLDSDTIVEKDSIRKLVESIDEGYIGASGVARIKKSANLPSRLDRVLSISFGIIQNSFYRIHKSCFILGKNFILDRKEFLRIFGRKKILNDIDISYELYKKSKKITFVPQSVCYEKSPKKMSYYWKRQERWIKGSLESILKSTKRPTAFEALVSIPISVTIFLFPINLILIFANYLIYRNPVFLITLLIGLIIILFGALKTLELKEILLLPIYLLLLAALWIVGIVNVVIKKILGIKIEWYKTPK